MKALKTVALVALALLVAGLVQLARGDIVAKGVTEEMQTSFFAHGNTDSLCAEVLPRGGIFVTCQGFLLLDLEAKRVTMQIYVTVFHSRLLADQDRREMMNWGAVGAAVLIPSDGFSLRDLRRLKQRRIDS